jgi:hypothetical protein
MYRAEVKKVSSESNVKFLVLEPLGDSDFLALAGNAKGDGRTQKWPGTFIVVPNHSLPPFMAAE